MIKKRRRKDLTAEEVDDIIAAVKKPYVTQKDVARQYQVSQHLVSDIVREAKKSPAKLQARR